MILVLAGMEAFTRRYLWPRSRDIANCMAFSTRARQLDQAAGLKVAFVGNSSTRQGIDPDLFARRLDVRGITARAEVFASDSSHLNTWTHVVKHFFWDAGDRVDLLVIPYFRGSLADDNQIEIGRLAQFLTDRGDWAEVLGSDLHTFSARADFLVSSWWGTYASRERVRERVFDLIPGYREFVRFSAAAAAPTGGDSSGRTYTTLARFSQLARERGTRVCFVALPVLADGRLARYNTAIQQVLIQWAGLCHIDAQALPGLEPREFDDELHLSAEGRARLTTFLANEIATHARCTPTCSLATFPW